MNMRKPAWAGDWRRSLSFAFFISLNCICCEVLRAAELEPPRLTGERLSNGMVRLSWESSVPRWTIQTADRLGEEAFWRAAPASIESEGGRWTAFVEAGAAGRFFRLVLPLTTIVEASPRDGEQGVSVGRETFVRFSAPLGPGAMITPENFQALFAGRRILSRVEVSSDRRRATLFYLEPLPGNARVTVLLDTAGLEDDLGLPVDGDGDGAPGGVARIWFDTLSLTPIVGTAVIGRVLAANPDAAAGGQVAEHPLAGVTITVDGREQDLRAVTDAAGNFTLAPVPAGRFFVHIDGRTAFESNYPDGAYYPFVAKSWDAVAGVATNLAGGTGIIYLPLIQEDALRLTSAAADTVVEFPASVAATNAALAATRLTVPANSLYSDNGTRGGRVGLAPVPPDRLPGPLPAGLDLRMVFTVQTDGPGNFDRPAPVCLPNIPEAIPGAPLPPGARRSLISFNHKKGVWESVGFMTVSEDGQMLCTDPGVGILQPGWHGAGVPAYKGPPGGGGFNRASGPASPGGGVVDGTFPEHSGGFGEGGGGGGTPGTAGPGGGGAGSGGPNGQPGSGTGGGNGDDGSDEERPCKDGDFNVCANRATLEYEQCLAHRSRQFHRHLDVCGLLKRNYGPDDPSVKRCWAIARELLDELGQQCNDQYDRSSADCQNCSGAVAGFRLNGGVAAGAPGRSGFGLHGLGAIEAPLFERYEQIAALLRSAPAGDVPADVQDQIENLLAKIDELAGGDAVAFLEAQTLELERRLAAEFIAYGTDPGNAPPYPVYYRAIVERPAGIESIRGLTSAFGEYEIFIPDDGELLRVEFYDARTRRSGVVYPNRRPEVQFELPPFTLFPVSVDAADTDGDGLADLAEEIIGTNPGNADTDGDGAPDGTEIEQGADPLDGIAVRVGVIAAIDTPGRATDVVTENDLAVVADGQAGVAIFDIRNPTRPVLAAQVDTPGTARAVAMSARQVAVADGPQGLAIIDLTAGLPLSIRQQLQFGSEVLAVAAAYGKAAAGLGSREVVLLDLFTGVQLSRVRLGTGNPIQDIVFGEGVLYVLTSQELFVMPWDGEWRLTVGNNVPAPGLLPGNFRRKRLTLIGDRLYASHRQGFAVYGVEDTRQPVLLADHVTEQFGWKQLMPVLPGLALSPGGADSIEGAAHDLQVYELGPGGTNAVFVTSLATPGAAVAVATWRGLAFVADDAEGLQVVNFRASEAAGAAPSVTLSDPALGNPASVVEGQPFRIAAWATDDQLVRAVEFYVDGRLAATAGRYPFERMLQAPVGSGGKVSFTVEARAVDTSGNEAWSQPLQIGLTEDTTPPSVLFTVPQGGRYFGPLDWLVLGAAFDQALAPDSITTETFRLFGPARDLGFGAGGDERSPFERIPGDSAGYRGEAQTAWLIVNRPLGPGRYRAVLTTGVTDAAGNQLAAPIEWEFEVFHMDLTSGGSATAAGEIERSGAQDILAFRARAGQQIYFDEVTGDCTSGLVWRCVGPDGAVLFEETLGGLGCGTDVGAVTLAAEGTYYLFVTGVNGATNSWSVALHDIPVPQEFPLDVGGSISEGVPGPGAGRIETPGSRDRFTFQGTAGRIVFFEEPVGDCFSRLRWRCTGPGGETLFDEVLGGTGCGENAGRVTLPADGLYAIEVSGTGDAVGTYAFTLWDAPPQTFEVSTQTEISDGQPGAGAGRIETPGASDVYTFTATAGARIVFQSLDVAQALTGVSWRLVDSSGAVLFDTCLGCTDPGAITLTRGGEYTLAVGDDHEAGVGTYRIRLAPAP